MGRRTYEVLAAIPAEAHGERMNELEKVVFSRTLQEVA